MSLSYSAARFLFVVPYLLLFFEGLRPFVEKSFNFPRDGLSDFFLILVAGIGACITMYAGSYFKPSDAKKFFSLLFLFTASMIGVLWSDDIFVFFTFWEATSFCSFLLIAFHYADPEVRKKARQALLVNMAGGLSLLTALLLLSQNAQSYSLTDIFTNKESVQSYKTLIILLIAFAAITKSAQFPFHFWLPNAMKAPTPASAYLHSATMVKLGVFLLARFSPLFEGNTLWISLLTIIGSITLILGLLISLVKTDLKQLFAWTTVSSLGAMFILVGLPYFYSWKAFFSYVFAHACYKASLFLCVGNIDKQIGTRNIYSIASLIRRMPMTSLAMILSLGSMIGLPFNLGFLGKEYLLKSALLLKGPLSLLIIVLVCSSALSFVVAYRVLKLVLKREHRPTQILREAPVSMWLPALLLSVVGWVLSLFLSEVNEYFLNPVVSSIILRDVDTTLEMWTGFNMGIFLSLVSLVLGILLSFGVVRYLSRLEIWLRFDRIFKEKIDFSVALSKNITAFFQNGKLSWYLMLSLIGVGFFFFWIFGLKFPQNLTVAEAFQNLPAWIFILMGILFVVLAKSDFTKILSLGIVGYGVALVFLAYGATDLAITQVAVETLGVLVFLLFSAVLKTNGIILPRPYQVVRFLISAASFLIILSLLLNMEAAKVPSAASEYFSGHAQSLGRGLNAVNVILVDFRALDTMIEICVLGLIGLGATKIFMKVKREEQRWSFSPLIGFAVPILVTILTISALYILWRGHNSPGGGFTAGVIYAIAVVIYSLVYGQKKAFHWMRAATTTWIGLGLTLALTSGFISWLIERRSPFTTFWIDSLPPTSSVLLFDIGVFFVVVGMGTSVIFSLIGRIKT